MKEKEKFPKASNEQLEKNVFHKNSDSEAINSKFNKEFDIDADNYAKNKKETQVEKDTTWNEKNFDQDKMETDLDFPGSELDVQPENKKKIKTTNKS